MSQDFILCVAILDVVFLPFIFPGGLIPLNINRKSMDFFKFICTLTTFY